MSTSKYLHFIFALNVSKAYTFITFIHS